MSCLKVNVNKLNEPIAVNYTKLEEPKVSLFLSLLDVKGTITYKNPEIHARCGIVCSISKDLFIRVPTRHIWLVPSNEFKGQAVVYSNVEWVIP